MEIDWDTVESSLSSEEYPWGRVDPREQILEAFDGYESRNLSIAIIADRAGLSKSTVYKRVDELVNEEVLREDRERSGAQTYRPHSEYLEET